MAMFGHAKINVGPTNVGQRNQTEKQVNIFVEIGNSDGKLDQVDWADYCSDMAGLVNEWSETVLGMYYSLPHSEYQNACFHFFMDGNNFNEFEQDVSVLCNKYDQESVAVTQGDTVFVTGEKQNEKRNPL